MKRIRKNKNNPVVIDMIVRLHPEKADVTSCEIMILNRKFLHEISGFTLKQMNATKRIPEIHVFENSFGLQMIAI